MSIPWGRMYYLWIDYADIQGDTYEQLYCARAQSEPIEVKIRHARCLAARLHELRKEFNLDTSDVPYAEEFQHALLSTDIVILSALTLVYRVIPPSPSSSGQVHHPLKPCEEALSTSRQALTASTEAWEILRDRPGEDWRSFILWSLLWCPFVPYLIVFGNCIVERNRQDFDLLEKVAMALQAVQPRSGTVDKLEKACKIFCQTARIYLDQTEAASQQQLHLERKSSQHFGHARVPSAGAHGISSMPGPTTSRSTMHQPDMPIMDAMMPDLPLSQQNWDNMFSEWDLGFGAENAREISSYFEQLTGAGSIPSMTGPSHQEPFG